MNVGNGLAVEAPASYQDVAIYADATYHFTPQFDIEVGGRYSYNWQTSQVTEGGVLFGSTTTAFAPINSSETSGTYSVAPRWHITPNTLFYARIATGYRPGGPQIPLAGAPASLPKTFQSDSTINYETGVKTLLFDGRLSADVSLFYIDWTRIQIESDVVINGNQYFIAGNGGAAVSKGVEWNFDWLPVHGLNVQLVGSYDQANLTAPAPGAGGLSGDDLAYVPKLTSNLNIDYEWRAFGDYKAFVGGNWSYVDSRYSDFSTTPGLGHIQLPSYDTFSLHGGARNGQYTVEVYVKNLTDARGITNYEANQGYQGNGTAAIIRPRTIGVRVAADF